MPRWRFPPEVLRAYSLEGARFRIRSSSTALVSSFGMRRNQSDILSKTVMGIERVVLENHCDVPLLGEHHYGAFRLLGSITISSNRQHTQGCCFPHLKDQPGLSFIFNIELKMSSHATCMFYTPSVCTDILNTSKSMPNCILTIPYPTTSICLITKYKL